MQHFSTSRAAKEFLVGRIVTESQFQGVPLSEIEEKMLYFSETAWTLPDMEKVNESFDADYDMAEYEQKITALIHDFLVRARKETPHDLEAWNEAVRCIRSEDHYLLVMIDAAGEGQGPSWTKFLTMFAIAIAMACIGLAILYFFFR